jgi:hypothetical protein
MLCNSTDLTHAYGPHTGYCLNCYIETNEGVAQAQLDEDWLA